jgi:hydroxymethylglutaryl-CoA synthase
MTGIVSYGTYVPRSRIRIADIAAVWQKEAAEIVSSLGISEKSVPAIDEDTVTLAVEAAGAALSASGRRASDIGALFVGSESRPYAVNPTSTIVGEFLGVGHQYLAADFEFACKAGSAGMQAIAGLVQSGHIRYGLAIGADTAQSKPHDILEYSSASGSAAFLLGSSGVAVELEEYVSYSSDTPDFWRRDGVRFPSHAGRFTGEPAYFAHVMGAVRLLLEKARLTPDGVDRCVFHMPNGKFPRDVAKRLGFSQSQLSDSLVVDHIGNPYTASSLLGMAAALDRSSPGQRILMASYGSGAGSDAFLWRTTDTIEKVVRYRKKHGLSVADQIKQSVYIGYNQYLKQTHKI